MVQIPEIARDLLDKPIVCALATLMPDGQPHVNPVWFDFDGEYIRINTARGRQKDRNMTERARVTVLVVDPTDDGHWIEARGHVAVITQEGAAEHINQLSLKYTGHDFTPAVPGQVRVIYKIAVDRVVAQ